MKVSINSTAVSVALIVMAVISLLALVGLVQIDRLVHSTLYDFGLHFSYRWALPYWTYSAMTIGFSWFNIIATIALTYHLFKRRVIPGKPEAEPLGEAQPEIEQQPVLAEYVEPAESEPKLFEEFIQEPVAIAIQIERYDVRHPKEVIDSQC